MTEDEKLRRWADRQIADLRGEVAEFVVRFEKHEMLEEQRHAMQDRREARQDERFTRLLEVQERNTANIAELTKQVAQVVEDTATLVQLQRDIQGAGRLISYLKRVAAAGGLLGAIATGLYWIITHVKP